MSNPMNNTDSLRGLVEEYDGRFRSSNSISIDRIWLTKEMWDRMRSLLTTADAQGRSVGDWLWAQLMDWCKSKRIAPATQDGLFAMVERARKEFDAAPAAQVAVSDQNFSPAALIVRGACESERADPEDPGTICISANDLLAIAQEHTDAAPAVVVDEECVDRLAAWLALNAKTIAPKRDEQPEAAQYDTIARAALNAALGREGDSHGR